MADGDGAAVQAGKHPHNVPFSGGLRTCDDGDGTTAGMLARGTAAESRRRYGSCCVLFTWACAGIPSTRRCRLKKTAV